MQNLRINLVLVLALCLAGAAVLWQMIAIEPIQQPQDQTTGELGLEWAKFGSGSEPIQPIPQKMTLDAKKVALGERLFHDPRLSHDDTVACATCHDLQRGGTDRVQRSVGIGGAEGAVNAPTVFNSGLNFAQFWDGRAVTLEEQIDGPIHHPSEMGSAWPEIIGKLKHDAEYIAAFADSYGGGIRSEFIKDAIATFERSLITPNSRFDRYLRGDLDAITEYERAGYEIFKNYGCVSCHQGQNIGGNLYQLFGILGNYFADRGNIIDVDFGRFNVTGAPVDRFVFKVPSLRNVALTAPYFHDGSAATLEDAVTIMAKYQLRRVLSRDETKQLVAFLKTLTGEYNGDPL